LSGVLIGLLAGFGGAAPSWVRPLAGIGFVARSPYSTLGLKPSASPTPGVRLRLGQRRRHRAGRPAPAGSAGLLSS
jgi:hypothetical protein